MPTGGFANGPRHRGILQPKLPQIDMLHCGTCGAWFNPDAKHFGCPHCAAAEELTEETDAAR